MTSGLTQRALRIVVWMLALSPLVWEVAFWLFVLRARLTLGHWPAPYDPDPKDLGFDVHYYVIRLGMPWILSATLTLVIFAGLCWREMKAAGARPLLAGSVACVTLAASIIFAQHDPGWFFTWFAD